MRCIQTDDPKGMTDQIKSGSIRMLSSSIWLDLGGPSSKSECEESSGRFLFVGIWFALCVLLQYLQ